MPMDIRNFFGKATAAKPNKTNTAASNNAAAKNPPKPTTKKSTNPKTATAKTKATGRRTSSNQATTAAAVKSKAAVAPDTTKKTPTKGPPKASSSTNNNNNNNNGSKQKHQATSVNTDHDEDDDDLKKMEDADVALAPKKSSQPKKESEQHPLNQKKRRVIVDDSDDDDDDDDVAVMVESKSPATKAKTPSPVKTAPKLSLEQDFKRRTPKESTAFHAKDTRVEVSVEDFFGGNKNRTNSASAKQKAKAATTPKNQVKKDDVQDDDEDEDYDVGHNEDDDDDDDDDHVDADDGDDEDDDAGKKRKSETTLRNSSTRQTTATKRKVVESNDDDKPPPRKSPRKQTSASPNMSNDVSSKPPLRKSPRKQATAKSVSSSSSTKAPTLMPLEPGLQLDFFDLDDVIVSECLAGTTFVFSGLMPNLSREAAQELVKTMGGRVTGSVSNKTTYLVLGDVLEDGRPVVEGKKYQLAKEKGIRLVQGEQELFGLAKMYHDRALELQRKDATKAKASASKEFAAAKPIVPSKTSAEPSSSTSAIGSSTTKFGSINNGDLKPPPSSSQGPITNVCAKPPPPAPSVVVNPYAKKITNPYASQKPKPTGPAPPTTSIPPSTASLSSNRLWADKYAPQVSQEILGNKDMVDKLSKWLERWETTFSSNAKVKTSDSGPKKAALLSGPPGIGKTTTATLVAREAGRDVLEFNASDVRSKKALQNDLGDVTGSQCISFAPGNKGKKQGAPRKRVLIMDEVDGMGAGDRNGMAELIKIIKSSRVPIICICNDRQSQKIRSLVPYCLDLRFRRPSKSVIANRAINVASKEGLLVERNAAEAIAESCGNDVRQVLNCLQMWASQGNQDRMTYKALKDRENLINKDDILRVNIFDATKMIVEGRKGLNDADNRAQMDSFYKRNDAFFVDYSLMGLNVHQNYMKVMMAPFNDVKKTEDPDKIVAFLERMHDAAHAMSDFAVVEREIRGGDMNWSLLPFSAVLAVKTGFHAGGDNGSFFPGFPDFPAWMGKNSTRGKKSRILQELSYHTNYKVSGGRSEFRLSYVPTLRERLYSMIANADESDTTNAIHLMDEYGLDRDDVFEKLDEFKIDSKIDFGKIEGKAKAAFTREYNSASHKSQALVAEQGGGSKRKRGVASKGAKDPADLDAIDEDGPAEAEESDGDAEEEDFEKIKKIFGKSRGGRKSAGQTAARGKGNGRQTKRSKK